MPTYKTLQGHEVKHEGAPDVDAFLARLRACVEDAQTTYDDVLVLAYGRENPILDEPPPGIAEGRGWVTPRVLDRPEYRVVTDMLYRKALAVRGVDPETVAAEYTVSVTEAARRLGITPGAVRQAIASRRITSWLKGDQHYLRPEDVERYEVGTRGPRARTVDGCALEVRLGTTPVGRRLRLAAAQSLADKREDADGATMGTLPDGWKRIAVLCESKSSDRLLILEPNPGARETLEFAGFYVRGPFKVVETVNNHRRAGERWETFSPE